VTLRTIAFASMMAGLSLCSSAGAAERPQATTPDNSTAATDFRIGGDDKQTRVVVDLTRRIDTAVFTLADPYRVVVDLSQVTFKLPAKATEQTRGQVKAFRYGLIMQGGSRIVLDTKGPVRVAKSFVLDATEGQPARLVLDLVPIDRASFLRNIALENRPKQAATAKPSEPASKPDDPRPLVVLDPGHGGIDNGTKGAGGELEKDVVLAFTQALREKLESNGKYRVAMTRTDDTFIPLGERVRFARTRSAALFISVHADALPRNEGQAEGATVYTLSENASDAEAARLAEAENKADVIAGVDLTTEPDDVANILVDLATRDQDLLDAIRADGCRRTQERGAASQASAEIGRLQGPHGTGCAFSPGGARLHVDQGRFEAAHVGNLACPDGAGAGTGYRCLLYAPGCGRGAQLDGLSASHST